MIEIKYVSSNNKEYNLIGDRMRVTSGSFHKYAWKAITEEAKYGDTVHGFSKDAIYYQTTLTIRGTLNQRKEFLNELRDSFENDILNMNPGRIYFGEYHIDTYITSSETQSSDISSRWSKDEIEIYCPYPFWIYEQSISIPPITSSALSDDENKSYPYGYPYGYPASKTATRINIDHYAESDFKMIIYGPAVDININIAGHPYCVHYQVQEGEYLTIDSRDTQPADRRIYLTKSNGEKVNVFNYRDSVYSVFKKIPPGEIVIDYNRLYGIDLTIYLERSEPKWILY